MATDFDEQAITFRLERDTMVGIIARPRGLSRRGVLIVVGGPQYRVGSHRQFVLLARDLAHHGIPSMRFDVRGMGDSSGALRSFENIDSDIRAALNRFFDAIPDMQEVVLWGLCDAASASIFYAHRDQRVTGLVLLNPWVRTRASEAKVYLKHYYLQRIVDPSFWKKVASGRFDVRGSLGGLLSKLKTAVGDTPGAKPVPDEDDMPLPERMAAALERFDGRVLFILSGNDLTAKEFLEAAVSSQRWCSLMAMPRIERHDIEAANHTFSSRLWRDQVAVRTLEWLVSV